MKTEAERKKCDHKPGKLGDLQVEEEGRTLQDDSDYLFKPPVCGYSNVLGPATAMATVSGQGR